MRPLVLTTVDTKPGHNPKAHKFTIGVIPAADQQVLWYLAGFAAMVLSAGFSWILVGTLIGATAGERHAGLVPRVASVALAGFAGVLVASAFG